MPLPVVAQALAKIPARMIAVRVFITVPSEGTGKLEGDCPLRVPSKHWIHASKRRSPRRKKSRASSSGSRGSEMRVGRDRRRRKRDAVVEVRQLRQESVRRRSRRNLGHEQERMPAAAEYD